MELITKFKTMRKLIFLPLLLIGCTKDWNCCIEATTTGAEPPYETINGSTTNCYDYRGTNDEKNQEEQNGTYIHYDTVIFSTDAYEIHYKTNCTPD